MWVAEFVLFPCGVSAIKKISEKERLYTKWENEQKRTPKRIKERRKKLKREQERHSHATYAGEEFNKVIDDYNSKSGNVSVDRRRRATVCLPSQMNFSDSFEETALTILIIRKFVDKYRLTQKNKIAYKLSSIDFDGLEEISTSAGLVLAATIFEWQGKMPERMIANHEDWNDSIKTQLVQLGFFELFGMPAPAIEIEKSTIKSLKYIRGASGDDDGKLVQFKENLQSMLDVDLSRQKWTFLYSGLSEAMTNALQHAYENTEEKPWFMTGGFDTTTRELKIVFYDHGIGIPKSLPKTHGMGKVLKFIAKFSPNYDDASAIRAAVEMGKTRTGQESRGKGLSDMLKFIKKRKSGYMSIMSLKGLYKHKKTGKNGNEKPDKTASLSHPIMGTLIIWSVKIEG